MFHTLQQLSSIHLYDYDTVMTVFDLDLQLFFLLYSLVHPKEPHRFPMALQRSYSIVIFILCSMGEEDRTPTSSV